MSEAPLSSTILDALEAFVTLLDDEKVPNAVIGAVGVCLVAQPRFTTDIDSVVWIDRNRWEALIESAARHGFSFRANEPIAFAIKTRVLLLTHEASGVGIDVSLGALPFEREMINRASAVPLRDITVNVATPEDLIITKAVAGRPKDIADIELIVNVTKELDLQRIRYWVREFSEALEKPEIRENLERVLKDRAATRGSTGVHSRKSTRKQGKKKK